MEQCSFTHPPWTAAWSLYSRCLLVHPLPSLLLRGAEHPLTWVQLLPLFVSGAKKQTCWIPLDAKYMFTIRARACLKLSACLGTSESQILLFPHYFHWSSNMTEPPMEERDRHPVKHFFPCFHGFWRCVWLCHSTYFNNSLMIFSKLFFFTALPIPSFDALCVCVVSVIVKRPVLPLCVVDGRSRNLLYYYYYYTLCPWLLKSTL